MSKITLDYKCNYNGCGVYSNGLLTEEQENELEGIVCSTMVDYCDEDGYCDEAEDFIDEKCRDKLTAFVNKHGLPEGTEFVITIDDLSS